MVIEEDLTEKKFRLVGAKYENGVIVPEEDIPDNVVKIAVFKPDCKKCDECKGCQEITYFAVEDENGDLSYDDVMKLKKKGDECRRHRMMKKYESMVKEHLGESE